MGYFIFFLTLYFGTDLQVDDAGEADISKREKARLKEMQRIKNQKIQEILDAQNAAIDADMVSHSLRVIT